MLKHCICYILIVSGLVFSLTGCGSETSGSISLDSPTYSNGIVSAKAAYTPDSGSAVTHQKITFYWRTVGKISNIVVDYPPTDSYTNSLGIASSDLILPTSRTESLIVYVKVSTGDLTSSLQSVEAL